MVMNGTKRKRKSSRKKVPKTHRVYCTYFPDGRYYIGYSCKTEKLYEKYYGSSNIVKEYEGELTKETIVEYNTRAPAKIQEFLLQWQQRKDENCLNDMIHIRLRMSYLKDFEPIEWSPQCSCWRLVNTHLE